MSVQGQHVKPAILMAALCGPFAVMADAPAIQGPSPLIHLADNLDEKDQLGWCIDTEGRGFGEQLQSHSCKPAGEDTQFSFDPEIGRIESVAFPGKCMTLSAPDNAEHPFGLLDCVDGQAKQVFSYDDASQEIRLGGDPIQCVVVAPVSIIAGPFMSRDLIFQPCADVDTGFKQWTILE